MSAKAWGRSVEVTAHTPSSDPRADCGANTQHKPGGAAGGVSRSTKSSRGLRVT